MTLRQIINDPSEFVDERSIGRKDPGSVAVAYALDILLGNGPA
jgi:hypothetical protein